MITGIIDIGTNTFNLLIEDEHGKVFYNDKIPVKLGKGGIHKNTIAADAFARGIDALSRFKAICREKEANQIFAFATAAVRGANNGQEFVRQAETETGVKINVIDGDREALFIYEGVKRAISIGTNPVMIVDIGGGSTEIVIANEEEVLWEKSYPLGVSRLLETFAPNDPLSESDISKLNAHFESTLGEVWEAIRKHKPDRMVGSSGSFETLHDICALRFGHAPLIAEQKESRIYLHELDVCSTHLYQSNITERIVFPGMVSMRADTIHLAALEIEFLLHKSGIKTLLLSMYALKEGVLFSMDKEHEPWQTSLL